MTRPTLLVACIAVCLGSPCLARQADEWNIEESRAPSTVVLDYAAEEGTWMSVDVSPDGRRIVFDLLGHIYEMPIDGGEATALTAGRSWNMFPQYSPDGARIAFTSDRAGSDDLWVMDRGGTREPTNVSKMGVGVWGGTWSVDGRLLYGVALHDVTEIAAYQFNMHGTRQELLRPGTFSPINHFIDDPSRKVLFFEHRDANLYASGSRIKKYDKETGEISVYIERPGGAVAPALSPNGKYLAYVHRNDLRTELILHDLDTREERVLLRDIDRDRQDYRVYHHSAYSTMAWHPNGSEVLLSFGGGIHAVNVATGTTRRIPFRARVRRELDETIRFRAEIPDREARTRLHRWAQRTDGGILFETLGDLYLKTEDGVRNLTNSPEHETSPVYDSATRTVHYAWWSDDELGAVYSRSIDGGEPTKLTSRPSQYGALSLSADGRWLAFLRGAGELRNGARLEGQANFELIVVGPDRTERKVTDVSGPAAGAWGRQPPTILFDGETEYLYFTEFENDTLMFKRIHMDGVDEVTMYRFPHAVRAALSPDLRWIAYHEYQRSYVTPFEFIGKTVTIGGEDGTGFSKRIDADADGFFQTWSADGGSIAWTRGRDFYEKSLDAILSDDGEARRTELSFSFEVDVPSSTIALTGVRVITMNENRDVLENATVLVRNGRIAAVSPSLEIPADARVFDLPGRTVMPGILDVHAHYGTSISVLNVMEQRMASLQAALAHGVTTMYEVYGRAERDAWVSDMVRKGAMTGPRLFSVGPPMYGSRKYRTKTYLSFKSYEDVLEHVRFNKAHGATALKDYLTGTRRVRHQIATAAREEGLNVAVEPGGDAQSNFTRIIDGATGIAHGMGFTPMHGDVVELLAASGLGVTPTLLVTLDGPYGEAYFHQRERLWENEKLLTFERRDVLVGRLRRPTHFFDDDFFHPQLAANLKRLYDAGVSLQLGGHGQMLGLDVHFEMELYSQGGFSNLQVLEIATINGARHQGLDHELGSIEQGKLADLIVLRENPLEQIRNTRSIEFVMKNGILYSGEDASRIYPDPRPAGVMYFKR